MEMDALSRRLSRDFKKFIGCEVHVVEVGIYSGGSLAMWRDYFGSKCHVYGIDIAEECDSSRPTTRASSSVIRQIADSGNAFASRYRGLIS